MRNIIKLTILSIFLIASLSFAAITDSEISSPANLFSVGDTSNGAYINGDGDFENTGDLEVGDDLVVTDDTSVGGDLTVTGAIGLTGNLTVPKITVSTLTATNSGGLLFEDDGGN